MLHSWTVPRTHGEGLELEARAGTAIVIVGANGSGKSALGYWLENSSGDAVVERLNAHRQIWMSAAGPAMTSEQRQQTGRNLANWNRSADSRWLDHAAAARPNIALFDLLAKEHHRNRHLAELVERDVPNRQIIDAAGPSPLTLLNEILFDAGLHISIEMTEHGSFDAVRAGNRYPANEMSDGEKSAMLLAAEILTGEQGTIFVLDEPERHLHRAISAGLITATAASRPDCAFVLLTHDLDLASSLTPSTTTAVVVSSCTWENSNPIGWDLNMVVAGTQLPEGIRRAVLGGRRRVLVIEGTESSLDHALYEILFPEWTPVAAGGSESVVRRVAGLRGADELHWIHASGLVDGDGRSAHDRAALLAQGVVALGVNEIESLYYSAPVMKAVSEVQSNALGLEPAGLLHAARQGALDALREDGVATRRAAVAAERELRRLVRDATPARSTIPTAGAQVTVTVESPFAAELAKVDALLANDALDELVKSYSIRESGLRGRVAKELQFSAIDSYEMAARAAIRRSSDLQDQLRELVGRIS